MNPDCTTALGVTYIEGVAWDLSERRMKMDPKDVRLCAEESGLDGGYTTIRKHYPSRHLTRSTRFRRIQVQ